MFDNLIPALNKNYKEPEIQKANLEDEPQKGTSNWTYWFMRLTQADKNIINKRDAKPFVEYEGFWN